LNVAEGEVEEEVLVRLKKFLREERRDLKREDAIEALKIIKAIRGRESRQEWKKDE